MLFTSYHDESIGIDTNSVATIPAAGDWGGIVYREDVDQSQGRFSYDRQGIFLNYVNRADLRFGGGTVLVDGVAQIINPIHVTQARPTITHNFITRSADAAISADPNSFLESNFHAPDIQRFGAFTSDYFRVGPDSVGNQLVDNSKNGLFVRFTHRPVGP